MDAISKTCSFCAEVIPAVAVRCPYCRSDLPVDETAPSRTVAPPEQASVMRVPVALEQLTPEVATGGAPAPQAIDPAVPVVFRAPRNEPDVAIPVVAQTGASEPKTAPAVTVSTIDEKAEAESLRPHGPAALASGVGDSAARPTARFGMPSVVGLLVVAGAAGVLATLAVMQSARKKPASIELSGLPGAIMEGAAVKVSVVVRNGNGASIGDAHVAFSVEPPNVAAIDSQGALTCSGPGDFNVIATVGDIHKIASSRCEPAVTEAAPIEPPARHRARARVVGAEGQSVRTNTHPDIAAPGVIAPGPSGLQATPWVVRADLVLTGMLRGASGSVVARSIQGITHPTGDHSSLAGFAVRHVGSSLSVRLTVRWTGGWTGDEYATVVVWSFDQQRHIETTVLSDNSPIPIASGNARQLDDYFRNELYSVLRSNLGD